MSRKTTGIVSYLGIIGWLIAYFAGDRKGARFHLNQSLVLILCNLVASAISWVPLVGGIASWILNVLVLIFWIMALVSACKDQEKEVPLLGAIKIL